MAEAKKQEKGSFTYQLDKDQLRTVRRREGNYRLRSNLSETDPAAWLDGQCFIRWPNAFRGF